MGKGETEIYYLQLLYKKGTEITIPEISYSSSSPAPPRILISHDEDVAANNEDREENQSYSCLEVLQRIWNRLPFRRQRQESIIRSSSTFLRGRAEENQLVIMGPSEVGKTALVTQLIEGNFIEVHNPTTEDNHIHIIKTSGQCEIPCCDNQRYIGLEELPSHARTNSSYRKRIPDCLRLKQCPVIQRSHPTLGIHKKTPRNFFYVFLPRRTGLFPLRLARRCTGFFKSVVLFPMEISPFRRFFFLFDIQKTELAFMSSNSSKAISFLRKDHWVIAPYPVVHNFLFKIRCYLLWQTRTEWNEVVSDGFFTFGMMTQRTAPSENWHLERGFELLRIFGLVRWGVGGSGHVEGTGEKLSFASQAAR
ncbi:hypothetical protein TNCV_2048121 [Trichonephila clavipes]|nr:hypothetical protein TNCV_2048121 [Trichonephila clavipes]